MLYRIMEKHKNESTEFDECFVCLNHVWVDPKSLMSIRAANNIIEN